MESQRRPAFDSFEDCSHASAIALDRNAGSWVACDVTSSRAQGTRPWLSLAMTVSTRVRTRKVEVGRRIRGEGGWATIAPELRLYDLRHVAVSEWVRAGVPLATVRNWAGHSSLAVTNAYTHVAGRDDSHALAMVNGRADVTTVSREPQNKDGTA